MPSIYMDDALLLPSLFCLSLLIVLCAVGLFSSHFKDNWLQHVGMFGLILGAIAKGIQLILLGSVTIETFMIVASGAAFGVGTAYKVWWHCRYEKPRIAAR